MDHKAVLAAIERAIEAGISAVDETSDPEKGHTYGAHIRSLATVTAPSNEIVREVADVVQSQPEFEWLVKSFYYPGPGAGGVGILPISVANWLLAKSLSLPGGAEQALSLLEQFAQNNTVDGFRVVAIYGIYLEQTLELDDNIRLVPVWELPPSLGLDSLAEALDQVVYHLPMGKNEAHHIAPAIAALVQRFKMSPALSNKGSKLLPSWHNNHSTEFRRLEALADAMVLLPTTIPQVVSRWVETDMIDTIPGLTGGTSGQFELMEIIPKRFQRLEPVTVDSAEVLRRYMRLPPQTKSRLATPMRRLAIAVARRTATDRAIELGVALESLFQDGSTTEIAHKVAVRGSLILSEEPEERLRIFRLLKKAYNLRSKAVHGNELKPDREVGKATKLTEGEVIQETTSIVRAALNTIVDMGAVPDWTEVDLGINGQK